MEVKKEYTTEIGEKKFVAQFTDLAEQADGSVLLSCGNTTVIATVVMSDEEKEGVSFFPLTVNYEERYYAAGQILGSRFMRREGKPSEEAVLSARAVDRTIRPLFNQSIRQEVQVVITVLSIEDFDPDVLAINATSLALATSNIPWNGPVSAIRVSKKPEEDTIINPTYTERGETKEEMEAEMDLLACGKDDKINMIETGSKEAKEEEIVDGLKQASKEIEKLQEFQKQIVEDIREEKRDISQPETPAEAKGLFSDHIEPQLHEEVFSGDKKRIKKLEDEWNKLISEQFPNTNSSILKNYFQDKIDEIIHKEALQNERRADGRALDEIRPLKAQAGGFADIVHGVGIFYRGATHLLSTLTLGGPQDTLIIDAMEVQENKRFMHHYNFPPYSVGETGFMGSASRRAIGHGALAEKALLPLIPSKEEFPYTLRLVSECMSSNGSTSMASVCSSTLALMDGGVPIQRPVAGIAMGLMYKNDEEYKILTDIQGPEDHHGDMDLKVAGTTAGITAIQMDVKLEGVPIKLLKEAFERAKEARERIIKEMATTIEKPREQISPYAPEITTMEIKKEKIGDVIGPGGKVINNIKEVSGVNDISVEEDGSLFITGPQGTTAEAKRLIEDIIKEYEVGEELEAEVVKITDYGAFARAGAQDGLIHISEIAPYRINKAEDVLSVGEKVPVKVIEIDEKGRVSLSIKQADPDFAKKKGVEPSQNNKNHN